MLLFGCSTLKPDPAGDSPSEAARHRASLATINVANETTSALTILFRSATPPVTDISIGSVAAGTRAQLAPVPAGEPIILIARRADGTELVLDARSFDFDAEWTWQISPESKFVKPVAR